MQTICNPFGLESHLLHEAFRDCGYTPKVKEFLIGSVPVSYTHLDVYKRQAFYNVTQGLFQGCGHTVITMAVDAVRIWGFRFLTLWFCASVLGMGVELSLIHI